jgi:hypothetical protein
VDGPDFNPPSIECDGTEYSRFHDFIYVSRQVEELDEQQVVAVCTLRDEFATPQQLEPNRKIQQIFVDLVRVFRQRVLVELGPGTRPLFKAGTEAFRYELLELNEDNVHRLTAIGYCASLFKDRTVLDLEAGSVDLVVAVFVLQFNIAASQIDEMLRVLSWTGLIVANVYRRSPPAREQLRHLFESRGCGVEIVQRAHGVGHDHEYWIISRDLGNSKRRAAIAVLERS